MVTLDIYVVRSLMTWGGGEISYFNAIIMGEGDMPMIQFHMKRAESFEATMETLPWSEFLR
jgi:hypothetical protein